MQHNKTTEKNAFLKRCEKEELMSLRATCLHLPVRCTQTGACLSKNARSRADTHRQKRSNLVFYFVTLILFFSSGCSLFGLWDGPKANSKQLWTYIQKKKPYIEYPFFPGKNGLYKSKDPHGFWLQTFVNETALESIEDKKGVFAPGSMIVTENYSEEKELRELTIMYKVEKYNPREGDWYWVRYDINGEPLREGKAQACIVCHTEKADNDYVFSGSIK